MEMETLHGMVHAAARQYKARVAVKFDSGDDQGCSSLTYNQLLICADELTVLLKKHGVLKEQIIGLCCQPGIRVPIWILGYYVNIFFILLELWVVVRAMF